MSKVSNLSVVAKCLNAESCKQLSIQQLDYLKTTCLKDIFAKKHYFRVQSSL
jgi:hypothetical protein